MYSWLLVGLSVTLSGMGFGFDQMMSERNHQPSARKAKATIHGMPTRSFGFSPVPLVLSTTPLCSTPDKSRVLFCADLSLKPPPLKEPVGAALYESPRFNQSVPSFLSTRFTSRKISTNLPTYSSGVFSSPS